jgi:cytoskeletal protein CcmA (bactofilin family)
MMLADFGPLTAAEQAVIDGLGTGHVTRLGDGRLPDKDAGEDRRVRAGLIRWLALGAPGDDAAVQLHEKGLRIAGALVVSDGQADPVLAGTTTGLDLEGCKLDHDLVLLGCRFHDTPVLRGARLQTLILDGSVLPGLQGDRLEARGSVFLRGVQAKGEVRLAGARIGGDLDCDGGRFETPHEADKEKTASGSTGKALSADGLEARGSVFLGRVQAKGEVRLAGARIGGDLDCEGGQFENPDGRALSAQGARVEGTLLWRAGSRADGAVDLTAARLDTINDDPDCWPGPGDLLLNRCTYGAFTGKGIGGAERIRWLDLQDPARYGKDFWPQPWEHCAHVLREMGHPEDARQVLIAKEERQRAAVLARLRREVTGTWRHFRIPLRIGLDRLLGALIAYGHRPLRTLWWLAAMWLLGAVLFGVAHGDGAFKPNNAFILSKPEWAQCADGGARRGDHPSTLACYRAQPEAAGYPRFNAALYSLDTLVPVVDLEVQDYWVPDETVSPAARTYLWVHIAMGWFLALLAVAGFSGLIDTRSTKD